MLSQPSVVVKSQTGKNYKKIIKKNNSEKNKNCSILIGDKKEGDSIVKAETSHPVIDLNDFPKLRSSSKNLNLKGWSEGERKSWFSVGNSQNLKKTHSANDEFPALPCGRITKEDKGNFNLQKCKVENAVTNESLVKDIKTVHDQNQGHEETNNYKNQQGSASKCPSQPQRNPKKKKRADPIFINLEDILHINKSLKETKKNKLVKFKPQRKTDKEILSGNYLDSSNPIRNRGKHREIKKKKLSNLKLAIIKERMIKRKMKETSGTAYLINENIVDTIDFKTEIEKYLNELSKRKIKNQGTDKVKMADRNNEDVNVIKKEVNIKEEKNQTPKEDTVPDVKKVIFTSKLREYCDNIVTPDLNLAISELIKEVINLQDRVFARDPVKAKVKKRHVSGIKEVKKHLSMKKVKLIVIAPNLEKMQMEGSVYDQIEELKRIANSQNVPYAFALNRYKLGRCTRKNVPVSAFAVLNYEGLEKLFQNVMHHLSETKNAFAEMQKTEPVEEEQPDVNSAVITSLISAFREQIQIPSDKDELDSNDLCNG